MDIIGAHNTGPFGSLGKARPGATVAYVDGSRYLCSAVFPGHNTGADLTDLAGNVVSRSGKLLMYTCRGSYRDVTVTVWEKA